MPKANRTCKCCGKKYYYCPSCSDEKRSPQIYIMWDSELCKDIFRTLTDEGLKKITTAECKQKLIELGVNENTVLLDSVRKHVDSVMSYEDVVVDEVVGIPIVDVVDDIIVDTAVEEEIKEETVETDVQAVSEIESIKKVNKTRTRKSSLKDKENSEVD